MIFDTHSHYDDEAFDADRDELLKNIHADGVARIVNCGATFESSERSVEMANKYDFVYAAVGVHPDESAELCAGYSRDETGEVKLDIDDPEAIKPGKGFDRLRELASDKRVVAIGEIGLDYHWDKWPREIQREMFIRQWELAISLNKPIEIHSRDAAEDTMNIVREMYKRERAAGRELAVDMHCYSYSPEHAREYVKMGLYFGIGGVVTFKNSKKLHEVVAEIPMERILLETDCPYLAPEPYRGKRNCSAYLTGVAAKIAELKGIDIEEVYRITYENAGRFFRLNNIGTEK